MFRKYCSIKENYCFHPPRCYQSTVVSFSKSSSMHCFNCFISSWFLASVYLPSVICRLYYSPRSWTAMSAELSLSKQEYSRLCQTKCVIVICWLDVTTYWRVVPQQICSNIDLVNNVSRSKTYDCFSNQSFSENSKWFVPFFFTSAFSSES